MRAASAPLMMKNGTFWFFGIQAGWLAFGSPADSDRLSAEQPRPGRRVLDMGHRVERHGHQLL